MSSSTTDTDQQQLRPTLIEASAKNDDTSKEYLATIRRLLNEYPIGNTYFPYGTAGFRYHHALLPPIMIRVGIAARLLNYTTLGVMVTASHNDESYNGVKLAAGPDGGMINTTAEQLAERIVNEHDNEKVIQEIELVINSNSSVGCTALHVGRDTRSHSQALLELLLEAFGTLCPIWNHGVVTTPMLHHVVFQQQQVTCVNESPSVETYLQSMARAYVKLLQTRESTATTSTQPATMSRTLIVDCACGVGYAAGQALIQRIGTEQQQQHPSATTTITTNFHLVNAPGTGPLNQLCGSEHVQKTKQPPIVYSKNNANNTAKTIPADYCCSLDGDADRIVFYYTTCHEDKLVLLDGDKMACLVAGFVQDQLAAWHGTCVLPTLGVVQTAYANGASTKYLSVPVVLAKTGVKFVHAAAHAFDIGIYFEANGHGTVVFGLKFNTWLAAAPQTTPQQIQAHARLSILPELINPAVGDAWSDLLLMDAILQLQNMTLLNWNNMYADLPSRQMAVRVSDRTMVTTNDTETKCLSPVGMQAELDRIMGHTARTFVRPSGTEDVVRVYAEAPTQEEADALADGAALIVSKWCGDAEPCAASASSHT
jgi:phosphoacetylglucosamine mutase